MPVPIPTPIYRFTHIDNLQIYLSRGGLHAPNFFPDDGFEYRTCHNTEIQALRHLKKVSCGPGGVIHDYIPFYFGYLTPMLLILKTGRLQKYQEGQESLIYLVSTCQKVAESGAGYIFSDGHGVIAYTKWFDELSSLDRVDWEVVYKRYWKDTVDDMDRKRRKQAEFLIHRFCDWSLIQEIGVIDSTMKSRAEEVFNTFPPELRRPVNVRRNWYY